MSPVAGSLGPDVAGPTVGAPAVVRTAATVARIAVPAAVLVLAGSASPTPVVPVVATAAIWAWAVRPSSSDQRAPWRWVIAVAASMVAAVLVGRVPAVAVVLAVLLEHRARQVAIDADGAADVVTPVTVLAVLVAALTGSGAATAAVLGAGVLALHGGAVPPEFFAAVGRGGAAAVRGVVRWAGDLVFVILALAVVLLPWFAQRCWRVDPLGAPTGTVGWQSRVRTAVRSRDIWSRDRTIGRPALWLAVRRLGVASIVMVALGALGVVALRAGARDGSSPPPSVPASAAAPWWGEYSEMLAWLNTPGKGRPYDPFAPQHVRDVRSEYLNVVDGKRRTWAPSACDGCRRVRVWMYGGSTTFGIGQRDEHTIASELARRAARDGLALDVVNWGVPADLLWQEAQRFAWDVAGPDRPDLVLFYDGINEMWASLVMNGAGRGEDEERTNPEVDNARRIYAELVPSVAGFVDPPRPDGVHIVDEPETSTGPLGPSELAQHVLARYSRSQRMSAGSAAAAGVTARWVFQPCPQAAPAPAGEPTVGGPDAASLRRLCEEVAAGLPDDIMDMSRLYDNRDRPLFIDLFHTNEAGARIAAGALYDALRPDLVVAAR